MTTEPGGKSPLSWTLATRSMLPVAMDYLRLRPCSSADAVHLYSCFARTTLRRFLKPDDFTTDSGHYLNTAGHFLRVPVGVKVSGLRLRARAFSDDLGHLTPNHKPMVVKWFHPANGQTVVDVGAGIGFYALWAANMGASVLAVEPHPTSFIALSTNVSLNPGLRVDPRNVAVGDQSGTITMFAPQSNLAISSLVQGWAPHELDRSVRPIDVAIQTLDSIVAQWNPEGEINWLLIDTEGYEDRVLNGAAETLRRTGAVIIEVATHRNLSHCQSVLRSNGLRVQDRWRQNPHTEYLFARRGKS